MSVSFNQLPADIYHDIFHLVDITDILRVRRVSRCLNGASRLREVWADAYRKAKFLRPPGPFIWQSADDLETALVRSFRVAQYIHDHGTLLPPADSRTYRYYSPSGTGATPEPREIQCTRTILGTGLISGRFLLIAHTRDVRCYDLDPSAFNGTSGGNVIYETLVGGILWSMHCVSATSVEGRPFSCVVLREVFQESKQTLISIYLVNVIEKSKVALEPLCRFRFRAFLVRSISLGPRVLVIHGVGDSNDVAYDIALDVGARTQVIFPSLAGVPYWPNEVQGWRPVSAFRISTSTHLLRATTFRASHEGVKTVFHAFTIPHPTPPAHSNLRYSHCGVIPNAMRAEILHDSVVDPVTGDILIAVQLATSEPSEYSDRNRNDYGRLCLSKSVEDAVGTVTFKSLGEFSKNSQTPFLRPSFSGTGRVVYFPEGGFNDTLATVEYDVRCEGCVDVAAAGSVKEHDRVVEFKKSQSRVILDYDPCFGRVCFRPNASDDKVIEILDLV